jgi:hypothetical protein
MSHAPIRFLVAALWPLTIWTSITHIEEHPADDYVERTSPIVAAAVAFWIGAAAWAGLQLTLNAGHSVFVDGAEHVARMRNSGFNTLADVLLFFLPLFYAVGFWLYTARDERFPR